MAPMAPMPPRTGLRKAMAAVCAALAVWTVTVPEAVGSPVPPAPPRYRVPLWPVATAPVRPHTYPAPAPDTGRTEPRPAHPARGSVARRVLVAVNRQRGKAGCSRVRPHDSLNRAAQSHSDAMARGHRLSHDEPGVGSPAARIRAAGYHAAHFAEDIAAGAETAEAAVTLWMHSPAHRQAILTCRYIHAGVGVTTTADGPWWTLLLATDR